MKKEISTAVEVKFSKATIRSAKKYVNQRDIIDALLDDGTEYSLEEVDTIINTFLTKEVK